MVQGRSGDRRQAWLLLVGWCVVAAALPAADDVLGFNGVDGELRLVVEEAIPWGGKKDGGNHLHLDLIMRNGVVAPQGWAWLSELAASEHPATVTAQAIDGQVLMLTVAIAIRDQFPYYEGGAAELTLRLTKYGHSLHGSYACTTTVMDSKARERLWRKTVGVKYNGRRIRGRVQAGTRHSRLIVSRTGSYGQKPPVLARGRIESLPVTVDQSAVGRPRLLPIDRAAITARSKRAQGQAWWAVALAESVDKAGKGGALAPGEPIAHVGFRALGLACRDWLADAEPQADQIAAIRQALAEGLPRKGAERWRYARTLVGLALAYDCQAERWPAALRAAVIARLAGEVRHVSGLARPTRRAVYNDTGLLGSPIDSRDPRLGLLRAAGVIAGLAIRGELAHDAGATMTEEQLEQAIIACRRSVRRFCRDGFGSAGAPLGHSASDEICEILFPALMAIRHIDGTDLLPRSGAAKVADWLVRSGGRMFDAGDQLGGPWLGLTTWALPASRRGRVVAHAQEHGITVANPWQAIWALALWDPDWSPAGEAVAGASVHQDRASGALVLRSGPDHQQDFTTIIETAQAGKLVAGAMGRVSVAGLGREWLRRPVVASGVLAAPRYRHQNVLYVDEFTAGRLPAVTPTAGGRVRRVRVAPDGSGASIGWKSGSFAELKGDKVGDPVLTNADEEGTGGSAKTWTAIGVDYSKASGAELAMVVVAGHHGFKGRPVTWSIDIGDLDEDAVQFKGQRFIVSPPGTDATMVGTVVFPPTMRFTFVPAADAHGAKIQTWMKPPPPDQDDAFFDSLTEKVLDLQSFNLAEDTIGSDVGDLDVDVLDDIEGPTAAAAAERRRVAKQVRAKVFRVTTSNKMGAPYLRQRVANHVVLALTVQTGAAPAVKPMPVNDPALLTIGPQRVHYWEHLVEFEQGMREAIRAHVPR